MIEIFKKPIEYLFDETKSILSKITYLGFIILFLIFVNDIFGFSYNYNISKKLDNINKIENIKKDYSKNYNIELNNFKQINNLENEIIERESYTFLIYNYLRQITIGKVNIDFYMFLSVEFFWLIMIFIFIFQIKESGIKTTLLMVLFIIFIMIIWQFLLQFISALINITIRNHIIFFNYIFNIIIIGFLAYIGNKKNKQ